MGAPRKRLRLRVVPGAGRSAAVGRHGDAWKMRVTAPPERGRANNALLGLLSETLSIPKRDVTLVAGHAGRDKIVEPAGISAPEIDDRLSSAKETDRRP